MRKLLISLIAFFSVGSLFALPVGTLEVQGRVYIDGEAHISTTGRVASIWFIDGTSQTTADTGGGGSGPITVAEWRAHTSSDTRIENIAKSTGTLMSQVSVFGSTSANRAEWNLSKSTGDSKQFATELATGSLSSQISVSISTTQDVIKSTAANLADSVNNAINDADNPVSWNSLKDVPAGFADGSDDGAGGSGLDVTIAQWNTHTTTSGLVNVHQNSTMTALSASTSALKSDAWTAINSTNVAARVHSSTSQVKLHEINLATGAAFGNFSVFITTTQDIIKSTASNLSALGTINTADNPVDWSKLKNVPAGFADGTDDGGAGGGGTTPALEIMEGPVKISSPVSAVVFDSTTFVLSGAINSGSTVTVSLSSAVILRSHNATFSGGGSAITKGATSYFTVPYNATIASYTLVSDLAGQMRVNIRKADFGAFAGDNASICGANCPSISGSVRKNNSSTLTGWNRDVKMWDTFEVFLDTDATTMTQAQMTLFMYVKE